MKVKAIVTALALVAAGAANAAISTPDLVFVAYDDAGNASFELDTGIKAASLSNGTALNLSLNISSNTNWSSFLTDAGAGAQIDWYLAGLTGSGTNYGVYVTNGTQATSVATSNSQTLNADIDTAGGVLFNTLLAAAATPTKSGVDTSSSAGYMGSNIATMLNGTYTEIDDIHSILGDTGVSLLGFQEVGGKNPAANGKLVSGVTAIAGFAANASGADVLTIATPAVPEPSSYGMALVALAGIGFMARRRAQ